MFILLESGLCGLGSSHTGLETSQWQQQVTRGLAVDK